jgi:hypothetical protein
MLAKHVPMRLLSYTDVQQKWPGATVSLRSGTGTAMWRAVSVMAQRLPVAYKAEGRGSTAAHHIPGTRP